MKKTIITLFLTTFIGFVFADNEGTKSAEPAETPTQTITLSGTVIDFNSGETLTGVEVKIDGTDIKAYTDFDGNFEIPGIKQGTYNLIASYISYNKSLVENLEVNTQDDEVKIKLQPSK